MQNIIFLDVDGVLNSARDFDYEIHPETIDCYVDTIFGKQHFDRVNREQLNRLREVVKLADAKVYLISSWSVAFRLDEILNAGNIQEAFNEFFGFEVHNTDYACITANGRAQYAIDLLNSIEYQDAVYLDDMQDFAPEIASELQSKCFVPVIKGSVGLRDFDFEAIKSYFGVANIN